MKKMIVLGLLLSIFSCFAHFPIYVTTHDKNGVFQAEWTPVQLGILPEENLQLFRENTEVYGFSFGLLGLNQESSILSFAIINAIKKNYFLQAGGLFSVSGKNYGFSISPTLNFCGRNYGIQFGLFNMEDNFGYRSSEEKKGAPGLQIGLFNAGGGVQIGLLNFNEDGLLPWSLLIHFPVK
ncbi:MAG: hypothetical protein IKB25_13745 [Lentisphaeria bacterium]|nr:hypothetical protein [Lentisphaeria bacterium]